MSKDLETVLSVICENDTRYTFRQASDFPPVFVVSRDFEIDNLARKFRANLALYPEENFLVITVPVYSSGLIGESEKLAAFYQYMGEVSGAIKGNIKLVPYHWDNSNRPVLMLSAYLYEVDEDWLVYNLEYLADACIFARMHLGKVIKELGLIFNPQARLHSKSYDFIAEPLVFETPFFDDSSNL